MNYFLKEFKDNKEIIIGDKVIYIRPWSLKSYDSLSTLIKNAVESELKNFTIIIPNPEEFEIGSNFEKSINSELKRKIKENNINIYFIFGSQDLNFYKQEFFLYHDPLKNMHVHLWPTYWFNNTIKYTQYEQMSLDKIDIEYCYCTLNYVGKYHRCLLIDILSKNDLIRFGAVSWYNFCLDSNYDWKWIRPNKMVLSDSDEYLKDNYNQQFTPPAEFFQSFMSIISETTDKTIFITEKTSMALLLKQPFLVQGAAGLHNYLKSLGFKLYTEVFDYSFDLEPCIEKRTEMIINNVKSILNSDLNQLYNLIKPKLEYNQKRFFEIVSDKSLYPQIVTKDQILKELYNFEFKNDI
jgi:hypothetical protein